MDLGTPHSSRRQRQLIAAAAGTPIATVASAPPYVALRQVTMPGIGWDGVRLDGWDAVGKDRMG